MPSCSRYNLEVTSLALSIAFVTLAGLQLDGQNRDLYPQVHALLLEAETASANIEFLDDRSNPHTSIGSLYAQAGYLEDAERVLARYPSSVPGVHPDLWRAWVVYGRLDRAEKSIDSVHDPELKARFVASLADLLWRMGKSDQARLKFVQAQQLAAKVPSPAHRKQLLSSIDLGLRFVSDPPPDLLIATPHPRPKFNPQDSPVPPFPITPDGFTDPAARTTLRAGANADFVTQLYGRVAARDPDGLRLLTESASTPFQKALGLASLEHLMILNRKIQLAEEFAAAIPESDSSASLAKAEAFSAAAVARLREPNHEAALADFNIAIRVVQSVHDLPLAKVSVLSSIATSEFKGGLIEESNSTFHRAIALAEQFPQRPKQLGLARQPASATHYKDEAFEQILNAAIKHRDISVANDVTEIWRKAGDDVDGAVVEAWLDADNPEQAISAVRKIATSQARVKALLRIARTLLDRAGAPIV